MNRAVKSILAVFMGYGRIVRRFAAAGVAAALGATLLTGATAMAEEEPEFIIENGNSSWACLEMSSFGSKRNVVLKRCDGNAYQWWIVDGSGTFRNKTSGHCLDGNGADVYTMQCNGGAFQKWTTTSGEAKSIRHTQSGKYLHADGEYGSEVVFREGITNASRWVPCSDRDC